MSELASIAWPASRLAELLAMVGRHARFPVRVDQPSPIPPAIVDAGDAAMALWIQATCSWLGFEAEPSQAEYTEVASFLAGGAPAVVRLPDQDGPRFAALLGGGKRRLAFLGPDHRIHRVSTGAVRDALCAELESTATPYVEAGLANVPEARRDKVRGALAHEALYGLPVGGIHLLRLWPGTPLRKQLRHEGLLTRAAQFLVCHALQYIVWLGAWWTLGRGALSGRVDAGWLTAWVFLLLTSALIRLVGLRAEMLFAIDAGALLKRRLVYGALRMSPDVVRTQGVGQLLGRVIESEAVETLALSGGVLSMQATIELMVAPFLLALGAGGPLHALLLVAWLAVVIAMARSYARRRGAWTDSRFRMTHDLVERMVGHRTQIAQGSADETLASADHDLSRHVEVSLAMDRVYAWAWMVLGRGWQIVGLIGLIPAFMSGAPPVALAVSLGALLLSQRALDRLMVGLTQVVDAAIAFRAVSPLFRAASAPEIPGAPAFAAGVEAAETVLDAHEITFRYGDRGEPVLKGVGMIVRPGDQVLLEGPSGCGKSTLASILTGLRDPDQGVLLVGGLDRETLGSTGWRRRVVSAPQFHENHVLSGTMAFNLLMGRKWPPDPKDVKLADGLCRELGLGPLLDKMPSGIQQIIGEGGWQLSHGEKSRLYIARALLQGADLVILDESFAALDPESLEGAMRCVLERSPSLIVIAHP